MKTIKWNSGWNNSPTSRLINGFLEIVASIEGCGHVSRNNICTSKLSNQEFNELLNRAKYYTSLSCKGRTI